MSANLDIISINCSFTNLEWAPFFCECSSSLSIRSVRTLRSFNMTGVAASHLPGQRLMVPYTGVDAFLLRAFCFLECVKR
ncbi:SCO-spondin precursor [Sesbania bispinosa]|nr:SCO-spondin precursor [Sesbania bispinosa]